MNFVKELLKKTFSEWADRTDYGFGLFKYIVIQAACCFGYLWASGVIADEDSVIAMVIVAVVAVILLSLVEIYVAVGFVGLNYRRLSDIVLPEPLTAKLGTLVLVVAAVFAGIFALIGSVAKAAASVCFVFTIIGLVPVVVIVLACLFLPGKWDYRQEPVA